MRILLINASPQGRAGKIRRYNRAWPPLDLLICAKALQDNGHDASIMDLRAESRNDAEIKTAGANADMVVLQTSSIDRWQCPDLDYRRLLDIAEMLPKEKLVLAGAHGTMQPEFMLEKTGASALIRGEMEQTILRLASAGGDPHGISGLSYPEEGGVRHEDDAASVSLDVLPSPAYELVDLDKYSYELMGPRFALLETSRGCPFSCSFCFKGMYGPGLRTKPIHRAMAELEDVVRRHKAENIYFIDLEFTLNREYTAILCREMIKMNLPVSWCCQTRADTVDEELLTLMKKAGCRLIHFGVETGSEEILKNTGKNISLARINSSVEICRKLGIDTACFFLFGLPGETKADRKKTRKLAIKLDPTYASFHTATPYPGTALNQGADEADPFPASLTPEHDLKELQKACRYAFLRFYLRPGYIFKRFKEGSFKERLNRASLFWEFVR